jgi:hypothetical protein
VKKLLAVVLLASCPLSARPPHSRLSLGIVYTPEQLSQMDQKQVTVEPGQGAKAIALQVDPSLINDAEVLQEVTSYVQAEGKRKDSHGNPVLDNAQAVNVPITPVISETK